MKIKILVTLLLLSICITISDAQVSSRSRRPSQTTKKKEKETFTDHLWYGGGVGLSFSSAGVGVSGSTFSLGLSPMVGYKITPIFSVGPRLEFTYTNGRFRQSPSLPVAKYNGLDYGIGAFTRLKILPVIFAHAELSYLSLQYPIGFTPDNKILTERQGDNRLLAGLGYTSGGIFQTEVSILYDFFNDSQSTQLPLVYRFGITYNF